MNSWRTVSLGEVLNLTLDSVPVDPVATYPIAGVYSFGRGLLERPPLLGSETTYRVLHRLHENDFVLSQLKAWEGALARVPASFEGWYLSPQFPTFRAVPHHLDIRYLEWYCKQSKVWEQLRATARGMGARRDSVSPARFLALKIPLPPLNEQQRIVSRIEKLAAKVEEARDLKTASKRGVDVVMDIIVGKAFDQVVDQPQKKLSELTSKIGSGSTPLGGRSAYPTSGVPFIRSLNVRMRKFQWDGIAFIDSATHDSMDSTKVRPNDVLLNITGASIGRTACAPVDLMTANVNQHVAIIRPLEVLSSRYLMYWLSQPRIQHFIDDKQKGATRQGFTKAQIEALTVPVGTLAKQYRIVGYLDALQEKTDSLKKLQCETGAELDALMPSILDKAFRGEL